MLERPSRTLGASLSLHLYARAVAAITACCLPLLALAQSENVEMSTVTVQEKALPRVHGESSDSYVAQGVEVGKAAQKLSDIPQSVTVLTRQRMNDQAMRTLDDVMAYTTGVTREESWLDTSYLSRGMAISNIRFDGGAASSTRTGTRSLDMAMFDS